jgi:hypothetical protein
LHGRVESWFIYLAELQVQFLHFAPLSNGMFLFRRIDLFFNCAMGFTSK